MDAVDVMLVVGQAYSVVGVGHLFNRRHELESRVARIEQPALGEAPPNRLRQPAHIAAERADRPPLNKRISLGITIDLAECREAGFGAGRRGDVGKCARQP